LKLFFVGMDRICFFYLTLKNPATLLSDQVSVTPDLDIRPIPIILL